MRGEVCPVSGVRPFRGFDQAEEGPFTADSLYGLIRNIYIIYNISHPPSGGNSMKEGRNVEVGPLLNTLILSPRGADTGGSR